jgi:hypothetical protein
MNLVETTITIAVFSFLVFVGLAMYMVPGPPPKQPKGKP